MYVQISVMPRIVPLELKAFQSDSLAPSNSKGTVCSNNYVTLTDNVQTNCVYVLA